MKTKKLYKYNISSKLKGPEIIDQKAKEKGCNKTGGAAIFCSRFGDQTFTDADGIDHTVGHRINKTTGETIEFHIKNSFKKYQKDQEQRLLAINND